jgi:predicted unusual protein kinase regulating ubiquinone biosynthesis (AarF/ABC1/UbiB family)
MNLLFLLTKIAQYKLTASSHVLTEIKDTLADGGCVWQKFAQVLSTNEPVVGKDLAKELSCFYANCPSHSDEYTVDVIRREFGDEYDTSRMSVIGSGTISQVYKMPLVKNPSKKVAIKVMHPNARQEIEDALTTYDFVKDSYLFPKSFAFVCKMFFHGLRDQIDMKREYNHGKKIGNLFNKPNGLIVIPEMIAYTDSCVVMSYEKSKNPTDVSMEKRTLAKLYESVMLFSNLCILNGYVYMDMHPGNYGVRNYQSYDAMKLVVYDFGQIHKLELNKRDRIGILQAYYSVNYKHLISLYELKPIDRAYLEKLDRESDDFQHKIYTTGYYFCMNNVDAGIDTLSMSIASTKQIYTAERFISLVYNSNELACFTKQEIDKIGLKRYLNETIGPYEELYELSCLFDK